MVRAFFILILFGLAGACQDTPPDTGDDLPIQRQDDYRRKDVSPIPIVPLPGKKTQ